jgi:hypothetical protein
LLKTKFTRKIPLLQKILEKKRFYRWATWASPKHKYLYVSIPKVACTRVKQLLQEFEGYPMPKSLGELHNRPDPSQPYVPSLKDLRVDECKAALYSGEWFRFSFVRNPYSRLFSAYKNKNGVQGDPDPVFGDVRDEIRKTLGYPLAPGKPPAVVNFRDFVHYVCAAPENRLNGHWVPQTQLLMLNLIKYDFIGRFENFQHDILLVLDRLGASADLKERAQICVNRSIQIHPEAAFDSVTAGWVYEIYQDDFVNFGYDRDSWMLDYEA